MFVIDAPEFPTAAASDLADIGSVIGAANVAASAPLMRSRRPSRRCLPGTPSYFRR